MIPIPRRSSGQAAMEFLTTYGWAILVVLVMISALSYFGILDPSIFLPEKCVFSAGISCEESAATIVAAGNDHIYAKLKNAFGYALTIDTGAANPVTVGIQGTGTACPTITCDAANTYCGLTALPNGVQWPTDAVKSLDLSCDGLTAGMKPRINIEIKYKKADGTYTKLIKGEIQVKPVA